MVGTGDPSKAERLYEKGLRIRERRSVGLWMPIMWHLAVRGHPDAMIELASWFSRDGSLKAFGSPDDGFSAAGLYRRAYRKGEARAAQHVAMSCFNRNDLAGYRRWLRLAARAGDEEAAHQLRCFETRLPHGAARKIGRGRPDQKRDFFA
jgi:TPR repeat protein